MAISITDALKILLKHAETDTGGGRRCAMFILSLWNGDNVKADLQALLYTDPHIFEAMLFVLDYLYNKNQQLDSVVSEDQIKPIFELWGGSLSDQTEVFDPELYGHKRDQADIDFEKALDSSGVLELHDKIQGLVEKSEKIHQSGNGMDPKKHPNKYEIETLYRTPDGGFFLHCKGGCMSQYAVVLADIAMESETIKEWNTEQAVQWLKENDGEHSIGKLK